MNVHCIFEGDKWYCYLFNWQFRYLPFPCNTLCIRQLQSNTFSYSRVHAHTGFSLSIVSDDSKNWHHCHFSHTSLFQYLVLLQKFLFTVQVSLWDPSQVFQIGPCLSLLLTEKQMAPLWDSALHSLYFSTEKCTQLGLRYTHHLTKTRKKREENLEMMLASHLSQYL